MLDTDGQPVSFSRPPSIQRQGTCAALLSAGADPREADDAGKLSIDFVPKEELCTLQQRRQWAAVLMLERMKV